MVIRLSIGPGRVSDGCSLGARSPAKDEMSWTSDPLGQTLEQQVHFSKEAASGGLGSAGGGCGCN